MSLLKELVKYGEMAQVYPLLPELHVRVHTEGSLGPLKASLTGVACFRLRSALKILLLLGG